MNLFPVLAQAATVVDAGMGLTLTSLLCSLGAAVAVVTLTRWFVGFLRRNGEGQSRIIEQYKGSYTESQRKFQEQLDRLSECSEESQHDFQDYIARISDNQNNMLRDVIVSMKNIEEINGGSSATIDGMKTRIGTLRMTVRELDGLLCDTTDGDIGTKLLPL
jgi:uncharacterized membrane protein YhiD involved in acid resistance